MCLDKNKEHDIFAFELNTYLNNSKQGMTLGLVYQAFIKLLFDSHVKNICRKASQKHCALSRISGYLYLK